jgi:hypothetical protein
MKAALAERPRHDMAFNSIGLTIIWGVHNKTLASTQGKAWHLTP